MWDWITLTSTEENTIDDEIQINKSNKSIQAVGAKCGILLERCMRSGLLLNNGNGDHSQSFMQLVPRFSLFD